MRTLRASEINTYLFCRRAWWYRNQGIEPTNLADLAGGTQFHREHGGKVLMAGLLRTVGWVALLAALALFAAAVTLHWLP
jgi:hypothetical protein